MTTQTQEQRALDQARDLARQMLAVAGGKLLGEEDIVRSGFNYDLPEHTNLDEDIEFLTERRDDEEKLTRFVKQFEYRPFDGARATSKVIRERFGFHVGKTQYSFFGRRPPEFRDIDVGVGESEQVIWGAVTLPGYENTTVYLGSTSDAELGEVYQITVECPRKYRWEMQGFFRYVKEELETNSMYRGKAIDGQAKFFDPSTVNPADVIYSSSVLRRLKGDVWRFIQHTEKLMRRGMSAKHAVLLEGPYGVGKSLTGLLTAQIALANGWTFFMCQPGRDDLLEVLQMARMYQPAVVFAEDVDTVASAAASNIEAHLDMLDGIKTKGLRLMLMLTTNHADLIHKGMLRPGRIGAVISFGAMDDAGIERLARRVIADELAADVDWNAVCRSMDGYMPAFVHEALNRAVRYSIDDDTGDVLPIGTDALTDAADSLRDQYGMMQEAKDGVDTPTVDRAFTELIDARVAATLNRAHVCDEDDGYHRFDLRVPATANGH